MDQLAFNVGEISCWISVAKFCHPLFWCIHKQDLGILSRYFKWNTLLRKINHKAKDVWYTDTSYFHSKLVSIFPCIFRTILAALHFNWNLNREQQKDSQGKTKLRVTYPKFKEGEETVRECRAKQNYGMTNFSSAITLVSQKAGIQHFLRWNAQYFANANPN